MTTQLKRLAIILLLAVSTNVIAHGHYPQKVDKYVVDSLIEVEFNLSNHFSEKTCFDIEVNGEIMSPLRTCLQSGKSKDMEVWVHSEPDVETRNIVCSIADNPGSIRTRMCTDSLTLFPRNYLSNPQ